MRIRYGFHGGSKAAAQLQQVRTGLKMQLAPTTPATTLQQGMYGEDGLLIDVDSDLSPDAPILQAAFGELNGLVAAT